MSPEEQKAAEEETKKKEEEPGSKELSAALKKGKLEMAPSK